MGEEDFLKLEMADLVDPLDSTFEEMIQRSNKQESKQLWQRAQSTTAIQQLKDLKFNNRAIK